MMMLHLSSPSFASSWASTWTEHDWSQFRMVRTWVKKANQQWPKNPFHLPDRGLCPKSQGGAWWQIGVPSALVLCCPFCFTGLATTTAKKGIFHLNKFPAQILSWPCPGTWQARQSRSRWCHCLSLHSATENPWPILRICYFSRLELLSLSGSVDKCFPFLDLWYI